MNIATIGSIGLSALAGVAVLVHSFDDTAAAQDGPYVNGERFAVEPFDALALSGGGSVTVLYGDAPGVHVIDGAESLKLELKNGSLKISCTRPCPRNAERAVEVTTDMLGALAVTGGGRVEIADDFPETGELSVAVTGGGSLDAIRLPAREVSAAVTGGGSVQVTAIRELNAAVMGGGSIAYEGDPAVNATSIGGGSVSRR